MPVTTAIYTIILTSIFSLVYIVILNFNDVRKDFRRLHFKSVAMQLLAATIWIFILTNIIWPETNQISHVKFEIILFVISVIVGVFLIKSISREIQTDREVDQLILRLEKNNQDLKEIENKKSEFISLASHQLRGPLVTIQGYSSLILEGDYGKIPARLQKPLEQVFQSSTFMNLLINDLLNTSRIERGQVEYLIESFDLAVVLFSVANDFKKVAKDKKLKFKIDLPKNKKVMVDGDVNKTKHIIYNLVENAIKYTKRGSVEIELAMKDEVAEFSIADTGIGIDKEMRGQIFKKFIRDDDAKNIDVSGTGLGLYVAQNMIQSMGGKIWVKSAGRNKGSTFYVNFPLTKEIKIKK